MIRLKPEHKDWNQPTHPLVRDAEVRSEEEIVAACQRWLDEETDEAREEAILVFSSCLRHIIGRWLGNFAFTRDHEDDLVQVGYNSIIKSIDELTTTEDVMNLVTNRLLSAQNAFINEVRTIVAPCVRTQRTRYQEGESMPETEGFNLEAGHDRPDPCNEILQVDGLDMVRQAAEDEIDEAIVHPDNWAKSDRVVARRLGISHMQVNRRRNRMINKVKEEMKNA